MKIFILLVFVLAAGIDNITFAFANNITVRDVELLNKNEADNTYDIQFSVAWENSWFRHGAFGLTENWDAAWVFVKYSAYTNGGWSNWRHATLINMRKGIPAGAQIVFGDAGGSCKGIFLYSSKPFSGPVNFENIKVIWNYGIDGVADNAPVKVKLFALEMVYIPAGNFYAGDGVNNAGGSNSRFFDAADPRAPVFITSEQPYISNVDNGSGATGDIAWINKTGYAGSLPLARTRLNPDYPTGYNGFYVMKYELSQGQYCQFLNTLDFKQARKRMKNHYGVNRNYIKLATNVEYGCDANNNAGEWGRADFSFLNEPDDGEWTASNWHSWEDLAAYADWAALRPLTELEFEKTCRGPLAPVAGEYAWGNAALQPATSLLINPATLSEASDRGNCNYSAGFPDGPYRCGIYFGRGQSRADSGAGYYGVMELSGNLRERTVSLVGSCLGRGISNFTGTHGDGNLDINGYADVLNWPGLSKGRIANDSGSGFRGGHWCNDADMARVSDRSNAACSYKDRFYGSGIRCARTAPG